MITTDENDQLFRRTIIFSAWSGFAAIAFFIIGGAVLGGMIPPLLRAYEPADEVVRKVSENLMQIRIGSVLMMIAFALFGPFGAGIAAQTRRAERTPGFSYVQLIFTACGTMVALLVSFTWALMVFRPNEYDPTLVQFLADFAYFLAVFSVPCFGGWCAVIALPILLAKEGEEPFPRWVGYLNLWAVLLFAPGQLILFFKDGMFSWHGIAGLWLPFVAFFLWILVMCIMLLRSLKVTGQVSAQVADPSFS
jgi:hypothetical protein